MKQLLVFLFLLFVLFLGCKKRNYEKGFQVSIPPSEQREMSPSDGSIKDSLKMEVQPSEVILTGVPNVRLTTIYRVNLSKDKKTTFIGSNNYYYNYIQPDKANNWNSNLMPGLEAVYGYNLVNVSCYNLTTDSRKELFDKPVLIKTLYYPSFTKDTLNYQPVTRNYLIVSVYDEDTNKDNFIDIKDLRRLYLFNMDGEMQKILIPKNYSVFKSEYDSANDYMYVFATSDENNNGSKDSNEPVHVFWIDLKNPQRVGRLY